MQTNAVAFRLKGRLGAKLLDGTVIYSSEQLRPSLSISCMPKLASISPVSVASLPSSTADVSHTLTHTQLSMTMPKGQQLLCGQMAYLQHIPVNAMPAQVQTSSKVKSAVQPQQVYAPEVDDCVSDDDDVLAAFKDLDALLAHSSVQQPHMIQPSASSFMNRQSASAHRSVQHEQLRILSQQVECAHTSTANNSRSEHIRSDVQAASPNQASAEQNSAVGMSTRRLWSAGPETSCRPISSMHILKRPVISAHQPAVNDVPSSVHSSSPLAGTAASEPERVGSKLVDSVGVIDGCVSTSASWSNERLESKSLQKYLQSQQQLQASKSGQALHNSSSGSTSEAHCLHAPSFAGKAMPASQEVYTSHSVSLSGSDSISDVVPSHLLSHNTSVKELATELQDQHLMTQLPGLTPALAKFAIQASL